MIVWSRRAPMFSLVSLTVVANSAIVSMPSSVKLSWSPSVPRSAMYCLVKAPRGSVRMRTSSSFPSASSSTRIGNRP